MDELDDSQLIVDKPEIPAFVAEEIEELKSDGYDLRGVLANLSSESRLKEGVDAEKVVLAYLFGYKIKKIASYHVVMNAKVTNLRYVHKIIFSKDSGLDIATTSTPKDAVFFYEKDKAQAIADFIDGDVIEGADW